MKREVKIIIAILVITIICFTINSRRVSKEKFDMMVFIQLEEININCNKRSELNITEKLESNHPLYNSYIDSYEYNDFCNISIDSINRIIEKDIKKFYKKNWKFVY
jgi:hypothetical protein